MHDLSKPYLWNGKFVRNNDMVMFTALGSGGQTFQLNETSPTIKIYSFEALHAFHDFP
jgi:hypothetical protein